MFVVSNFETPTRFSDITIQIIPLVKYKAPTWWFMFLNVQVRGETKGVMVGDRIGGCARGRRIKKRIFVKLNRKILCLFVRHSAHVQEVLE